MVNGAHVAESHQTVDRQKPGPVTVRGVVDGLSTHSFTLKTAHHGNFQVTTQPATRVIEKGKSGKLTLRNGDHVGVRGFEQGQTLSAIEVRIYPVKPKAYSLKGTVISVSANAFVLTVGGRKVEVRLTGATTVLQNHQIGGRIQSGDRVEVRLLDSSLGPTALHIHVFVRHLTGKHVRIQGIIEVASVAGITLRAGSHRVQIVVAKATSVRLGRSKALTSSLRAGQTVTVYACCAGAALQATSIHIRKTALLPHSTELKGRVVSLPPGQLALATGRTTAVILIAASTPVQVGSKRGKPGDIHVGDQVTVRATPAGNRWQALRVHVLAISRRLRTIVGAVTALSGSNLTVVTAVGKRYLVQVERSTAVVFLGAASHPAVIRKGDHVRAKGYSADGRSIAAIHLEVRRQLVKQVTVRGTIISLSAATWVVADAVGGQHRVLLSGGVHPRLRGTPAPAAAVFVGARVTVHGQLTGGRLVASSVTVTARSRIVSGRVVQIGVSFLTVRIHSGTLLKIDLVAGVAVSDGSRRLQPAALSPGAFVRVTGFEEPSLAIRAVSIAVQHPIVSVSGVVVVAGSKVVLQTTSGERYALHLGTATHVESSRTHQALAPTDLPNGTHAHVDGTVDTQGVLAVSMMSVRLVAVTLAGRISRMTSREWTILAADGNVTVRFSATTPLSQGSHAISVADVVVQDDVTVDGYALAGRVVLARRILVHRRLVGLDGVIGALSAKGFVLQAGDGDHTIVVGTDTAISGVGLTLQSGQSVHVSGYLRGDGVVLATRIRILKQAPAGFRLTGTSPALRYVGRLCTQSE